MKIHGQRWMLCTIIILLCQVTELLSYEECKRSGSLIYYCDSGWHCCLNDEYCCRDSVSEDTSVSLSGIAIAGIVIGSIFGLIVLISVGAFIAHAVYSSQKTVHPTARTPARQANTDVVAIDYISNTPPPYAGIETPTPSAGNSLDNVLPNKDQHTSRNNSVW